MRMDAPISNQILNGRKKRCFQDLSHSDLQMLQLEHCHQQHRIPAQCAIPTILTGECNSLLPEQASVNIPEVGNKLASTIVNKPKTSPQKLSQSDVLILQAEQSRLPARFGILAEAQVPRERSLKLPRLLSVEQSFGFQKQGFYNVQASQPTDSVLSLNNMLFSYLNFKSMQVDANGSCQEFVDDLHLKVCNGTKCLCEKYCILKSHFDNCHYTYCNICAPMRAFCTIKNNTSESGKLKGDLLGDAKSHHIIKDTQHFTKRMKVDNAVLSEDQSLGAIVGDYIEGNGRSERANKCFERTEGHSDLGLSTESPVLSNKDLNTVNEGMHSSIRDSGENLPSINEATGNDVLENDNISFDWEELNLSVTVHENGDISFDFGDLNSDNTLQEMECVNTK